MAHVVVRPYPNSPGPLAVGAGEVHVWQARLDDVVVPPEDLLATLTVDERDRADRYRHPRPRTQFVRTRGLLRTLLGRYLGRSPESVPITVRPDGKPVLDGPAGETLRFNVSHTDAIAVFAVGRADVGVDVETVRELATADGLVERFFSAAERDQYFSLPPSARPAAFFRGWTCKEAVLKGIGCGTRDLDRCVVDLDPAGPPRVVGPAATAAAWELTCWSPDPTSVAAVATEK